jgi:hypothetical protein
MRRPRQRFRTKDPRAFHAWIELLVRSWGSAARLARESGVPPQRISDYLRDPQAEPPLETVRGLIEATYGLYWFGLVEHTNDRAMGARLTSARDEAIDLLDRALAFPREGDPADWNAALCRPSDWGDEADIAISYDPFPARTPNAEERGHIERLARSGTRGAECHRRLTALLARGSLTLRLPHGQAEALKPFGFEVVSSDDDECVVHRI